MSEEVKDPGGMPDASVGDTVQEAQTEAVSGGNTDSVSYQNFKKAVDEKKRFQQLAQQAEERAQRLEQERLEKEGKLSELVDSLRKENSSLKNEKTKIFGDFAYRQVSAQLQAEAAKAGCLYPEALERLVDMDNIEVDAETFKAQGDQVKTAIEDIKRKMPSMFGKPSPSVNTSNPQIDVNAQQGTTKKLKDLKDDDLMKLWEQAEGRG